MPKRTQIVVFAASHIDYSNWLIRHEDIDPRAALCVLDTRDILGKLLTDIPLVFTAEFILHSEMAIDDKKYSMERIIGTLRKG